MWQIMYIKKKKENRNLRLRELRIDFRWLAWLDLDLNFRFQCKIYKDKKIDTLPVSQNKWTKIFQ